MSTSRETPCITLLSMNLLNVTEDNEVSYSSIGSTVSIDEPYK